MVYPGRVVRGQFVPSNAFRKDIAKLKIKLKKLIRDAKTKKDLREKKKAAVDAEKLTKKLYEKFNIK